MAQAAVKLGTTTIDEFDRIMEQAPEGADRYELVDGHVVAMGNPTLIHEQIVSNIAAPLHTAVRPGGCSAITGNMRVSATDDRSAKNKFKPDILVRCGPVNTRDYVTDPVVIVEVLSPSTMDRDRGVKLEFYKQMPTIQHIVLAYADSPRIEHYFRSEEGWDREVLLAPEHVLKFAAVGFEIELEQIYQDVPFENAPRVWIDARGSNLMM
ncbi:MAG: hypothetical protein CFE29_08575 [Bradyrhizobiaceae bacterium PARB1]|jgi:Uma2 family endonuclease|nr:MAG: hypothetical protein CFE29_08575 [Bradyrhizobiaceae bacterium PARB1]